MTVPVVTTSSAVEIDNPVDPRLVFLTRAAARLTLVEAAVADLIPPCACARETVAMWELKYPPRRHWGRK